MVGPMAASRSCGRLPNSICICPIVLVTMRARVPRQPAWIAAIARFFGSTSRTGAQSAVRTPSNRPARLVVEASPLYCFVGMASKGRTMSEWIWWSETSVRSAAPSAAWKRRLFSSTFSRVSHSTAPRFRTFSPSIALTPPGRVLKPWKYAYAVRLPLRPNFFGWTGLWVFGVAALRGRCLRGGHGVTSIIAVGSDGFG